MTVGHAPQPLLLIGDLVVMEILEYLKIPGIEMGAFPGSFLLREREGDRKKKNHKKAALDAGWRISESSEHDTLFYFKT
jgi:hypothetical protein